MTDLIPVRVMHPTTGEVVDLTDTPGVVRLLHALREHKAQVDQMIRACEDAVSDEMDRRGEWTLHLDGLTAEGQSCEAAVDVEWDHTILAELKDAGLPADRYAELVVEKRTLRVDKREAKKLAKVPAYQEILERAATLLPKRRYVKTKRAWS